MKSYGVEVPESVLQAGMAAMNEGFVAYDIKRAILDAGCPYKAYPSRVVDRLLQRERRAGRIALANGLWRKTP